MKYVVKREAITKLKEKRKIKKHIPLDQTWQGCLKKDPKGILLLFGSP